MTTEIENTTEHIEAARIKEIHHIVKNNLQIISSLIDLQMGSLKDTNCIKTLREIQGRITSIAFVHDELYSSKDLNTLDFSSYLQKMIRYLLDFYKPEDKHITLKLNVEQIFVGMDTAIPLGIIVNELLSNAVHHAFPDTSEGEVSINLCKAENYKHYLEEHKSTNVDSRCQKHTHFQYVLIIQDNGIGFLDKIDFEHTNSLGLQIVNLLVNQIDGCINLEKSELKNGEGTKYSIWFSDLRNIVT